MVTQQCLKGLKKTALQLASVGALGLALSGCASVSIPFGNLMGGDDEVIHTGSIANSEANPESAALPAELSAVAPVEPPDTPPSARPADDLIASIPQPRPGEVALTQADLDAMSRALTFVLDSDEDAGTFSWSHDVTGRSGLMTPFRQLSRTDQGACRVVSIEITDDNADAILLGDACLQDGQWVFVNPVAGQTL